MMFNNLTLLLWVVTYLRAVLASTLPGVQMGQGLDTADEVAEESSLHDKILSNTMSLVDMALQHAKSDMSLPSTNQNTSESGLVVMPPTLNVDIASLIKLAVELEQNKKQDTRNGLNGRKFRKISESPLASVLVDLGGTNYFFSTNQKFTWINSLAFCNAHGMDLVSMETVEEKDLIADHIVKLGSTNTDFFISGNKIGRSSHMWANGAVIDYENFGKLTDFNNEHCLVINNKKWYDAYCDKTDHVFKFICEERTQ